MRIEDLKSLYIPIWFYFNQLTSSGISDLFPLYIPIWFYFNFTRRKSSCRFWQLYIPIWFYFNVFRWGKIIEQFSLYIPIWFYFNSDSTASMNASIRFTFQYGSTLIHSCQFRIFFMLICSFLSTSLYLFYFPIHFIMFFIKKPLIPFIYIPLSTSSHFYFIEHRQNFSLLIYIIYKFNFIISHFIISALHNFNFFT